MASPTFVSSASVTYDTSTPKSTASISVQAGDILVAKAGNGDTGDGAVTVSGGGLTWTQQQTATAASHTTVWLWTATASSTTSFAVTFARPTGTGTFGGVVEVYRNAAVGASNSTTGTGAPSLSLTTTAANSAISCINQDWNAVDGASRTWRTVNSITPSAGNGLETYYQLIGGGLTAYDAYWNDAGSAAAKTVGLSAPTGQNYTIAAVEVKGTTATSQQQLTMLGVGS